MKQRGGVPMGPFELMDFIGLEVNFKITQIIYLGLGKPDRLKPHRIQEDLVANGAKGRKSGAGFYLYENGKNTSENPAALKLLPSDRVPASSEAIWERIMSAIAEEAHLVVKENVASKKGVDMAVQLAMNFPQGPFAWTAQSASSS